MLSFDFVSSDFAMMDVHPLAQVIMELRTHVDQLLLLLNSKEKFVVQKRFSLDEKGYSTLEEVGKQFGITRERVRQIENNALQKLKRNVENSSLNLVNKYALQLITDAGGLMLEQTLLSKLIEKDDSFEKAALELILSLDKRFERVHNTIHFRPYAKLKTLPFEVVQELASSSMKYLNQKKELTKVVNLLGELKNMGLNTESHFMTKELLQSVISINKHFKVVDDSVGLIEWRHINPKTIRDKVYFVLRQKGEPMHFVDIANSITGSGFNKKNLNLQAIHNELIRHDDFVLIGRGIYALKEWGFSSGTVSDVICKILKSKGSLSQDDIIQEVLKERKVKAITIILNLKNNKLFTRVGRTQYELKN